MTPYLSTLGLGEQKTRSVWRRKKSNTLETGAERAPSSALVVRHHRPPPTWWSNWPRDQPKKVIFSTFHIASEAPIDLFFTIMCGIHAYSYNKRPIAVLDFSICATSLYFMNIIDYCFIQLANVHNYNP